MTHEIQLASVVDDYRASQAQREPRVGKVRALVGDGAGNLVGPNGVPWVLCRLGGDSSRLVQAYNASWLIPAVDMSVTLLEVYDNDRVSHYELRELNNFPYVDYNPSYQGGQGLHHLSHEIRPDGQGGFDAVFSYPRARTDLRLSAYDPPTLHLYVFPGWYRIGSTLYRFDGGDVGAFTPPGSGIQYAAVFIDATGAFTIVPDALLLTTPFSVALISDKAPLGLVQLTFGQTGIADADLVQDLRYIVEDGGSGGGGGSGSTTTIATDRWAAVAAQTDFALPDTADYLVSVSVNGLVADPLTYSLSTDGNTLTFSSGLSASDVVVANYAVLTI